MSDKATDDQAAERPEGESGERREPATSEHAEAAAAGADREEELRQEAAENWSKYLRAAAELENLRKRASRDLENARKYGVERLAAAIIPVRDSIEAGLGVLDGDRSPDVAAILEGEQATLRLLDQALEASGIREIDPLGEPFDPTRHEAMTVLESAESEPDSVLEVIQKGYSLHERILRPARVVVAKAPAGGE